MKTELINQLLQTLLQQVEQNNFTKSKLIGWERVIRWEVDDCIVDWKVSNGKFVTMPCSKVDLHLRCSIEILKKITDRELGLFIALWGTGDVQYNGTFADAFYLGYLFINDQRGRKVIFLAHCFLNTNTRFPGGCAFSGLTEPLIEMLIGTGVGLIQMPCPEFLYLGLEKEKFGLVPENELRSNFRKLADSIVGQMKEYINHGYQVIGVIGMNPSPSCGVDCTKGKGIMLGRGGDLSEQPGAGAFIEELKNSFIEQSLDIPCFGFRRILPGEASSSNNLEDLQIRIKRKIDNN